MKRILVSQIGLGAWGKKVYARVSAMPEFEVIGIADRGTPLDAYLPDLVLISTPVTSHFELAKKSLEIGCHVWITKPVTLTLQDLAQLQTLAAVKNRRIFYDHTYVFNSRFQTINQGLTSLSPLLSITSRRGHTGGWQKNSTALEELIYHDIYIALAWSKQKPLSVELTADTSDERTQSLKLRLQFPNALFLTVDSSQGWKDRERLLEVSGADWKITWQEDSIQAEPPIAEVSSDKDAIELQFRNIHQVLTGKIEPLVTDAQAFETMKVIELARRSLLNKSVVNYE